MRAGQTRALSGGFQHLEVRYAVGARSFLIVVLACPGQFTVASCPPVFPSPRARGFVSVVPDGRDGSGEMPWTRQKPGRCRERVEARPAHSVLTPMPPWVQHYGALSLCRGLGFPWFGCLMPVWETPGSVPMPHSRQLGPGVGPWL